MRVVPDFIFERYNLTNVSYAEDTFVSRQKKETTRTLAEGNERKVKKMTKNKLQAD